MPPTLTLPPTRRLLFTDLRHILCHDIDWATADGKRLPLIDPPQPQVDAYPVNMLGPRGVRLLAHKASKTDLFPKPGGVSKITRDGGVYRTWFSKVEYPPGKDFGSYSTEAPIGVSVAYSESSDGFHWSEPRLSPINVPGLTALDGFTWFIDTNPACPEGERYKVVYMASVRDEAEKQRLLKRLVDDWHPRYRDPRITERGHVIAIFALTSPDGLNWTPHREPLMVHMSDTDTTVSYDAYLGKYVMFTRLYHEGRRSVGRAESDDFFHWKTGPEEVVGPRLDEPLSRDVYLNAYTHYPGLPGEHLMFPMFYNRFDQTSEVRMYSSTTGVHWKEVPGGPVVEPGPIGSWDSEFIFCWKDMVELGADRVAMPYWGVPWPHKYPRWPGIFPADKLAYATWPSGRLACVKADEEGEFYTMWFNPTGRNLKLNFRARRGGFVRVGLFEVPGRTADDCDPMYGDDLSRLVTWKGSPDFATPEGQIVMLHFKLRAAEVYGVEFA